MNRCVNAFLWVLLSVSPAEENSKIQVLVEKNLTFEGQPIKVQVIKREIEFRGIKDLPGATAKLPPRPGVQVSVTRQIGRDGPVLQIASAEDDGRTLAESRLRGQLETDGEFLWVMFSTLDGQLRGGGLIEVPLMSPGNPLDNYFDASQFREEQLAGKRVQLGYRMLNPPPRNNNWFGSVAYAKMSLEDGVLVFNLQPSGAEGVLGVSKLKYDSREQMRAAYPEPSADPKNTENDNKLIPPKIEGVTQPNPGVIVPSVADNPPSEDARFPLWLLWSLVAVFGICAAGFFLKRSRKQ